MLVVLPVCLTSFECQQHLCLAGLSLHLPLQVMVMVPTNVLPVHTCLEYHCSTKKHRAYSSCATCLLAVIMEAERVISGCGDDVHCIRAGYATCNPWGPVTHTARQCLQSLLTHFCYPDTWSLHLSTIGWFHARLTCHAHKGGGTKMHHSPLRA
jgi:hypothetical protein